MGKERQVDPLEIIHMKVIGAKDMPLARALIIPSNYSHGSLKEILTGIVWGKDLRSFIYFPNDITKDMPHIISDEELKELRFEERADRLAQLDIYAMTLKTSPLKILVEQIY